MKTKASIIAPFILLLFALQPFCKGQTCTPTPIGTPTPSCSPYHNQSNCTPYYTPCQEPTPSPVPTAIPTAFQPPGKDGMLKWRVLQPPPTTDPPWPVCLIIHPGEFYYGTYFDNDVEQAAQDIAAAGFYTLIVNYRLAQCNIICLQDPHDGNPNSGGPVEQTNDIKALIKAARADANCKNGQVVAIGGSAGASHAILCAVDKTVSTSWPYWYLLGDDRLKAAVGLSGAYDYADRTSDQHLSNFVNDIENYTSTCKRSEQAGFSPITQVKSDAHPIFVVNSYQDTMPYHQILDIQCALQNAGVTNFQALSVPGQPPNYVHAFHLWLQPVAPGSTELVRDAVIQFLNSHVTH